MTVGGAVTDNLARAQNAMEALQRGKPHKSHFGIGLAEVGQMLLGDLAALDSDSALRQRLRHYAASDLLLIDEVGYLSYSNRHACSVVNGCPRRLGGQRSRTPVERGLVQHFDYVF